MIGKRILVVEDDPTIRSNIARLLQLEDFTVITAENGAEGLARARAEKPDLVLSDAMMPILDGYGLLEQLRADPQTATTPFIFLTAKTEKVDMRRGMNLGADDFLTKPVTREDLLEAITARLRRVAQQDQRAHSLGGGWMDLRASDTGQLPLDNSTCRVSVLFADVRNFTTLSERLPAPAVAELLNAYFREACDPLIEHGGRIVRFVGDGVMAVFMDDGSDGGPHRSARRALRAALRMVLAAQNFRSWIEERHAGTELPEFAIGVGVHSGEVALTLLGSRQQSEFTIIGDTVNIAARLEAKTKDLGWSVIASDTTVDLAGPALRTGRRAVVPLKGRSAPVHAHEIVGLSEDIHDTLIIAPDAAGRIREALEQNARAASAAAVLRGNTLEMDAAEAASHIFIRGYRILRRIGSGGMSEVFLARRESDDQELVLKVLDTRVNQEPQLLNRFIQEFALLSRIDHPNVVRIFDQGFTDEHVYIAMEYFPGGDIKRRMAAGFEALQSVGIGLQLAQALAQVHALGIVHRDLKPENLMLRGDGSIALADFGIAKHLTSDLAQTRHGQVVGTPFYMSPEQAMGQTVTAKSDLYSLGVLLFELLSGQRPYMADNIEALMSHHMFTPVPDLPADLADYQELVNRLMEKEPAKRFDSADDVVHFIRTRWPASESAGLTPGPG